MWRSRCARSCQLDKDKRCPKKDRHTGSCAKVSAFSGTNVPACTEAELADLAIDIKSLDRVSLNQVDANLGTL